MNKRTLLALLATSGVMLATPALGQTPTPAPTPAPAPAPKVTLTTTLGAIEITLDPVGAPKTSAHMLKLFQSRHYIGAAIYRIEPGFVVQLGDLDAQFKHRWPPENLRATVPLETATNAHAKGTVSLARGDDPNSGATTFYFDLGENSSLNANPTAPPNTTGYATFGKVTAGWEVVEAIAAVERAPTGGPFPGKAPKVPIVVTAITTDPPARPEARPSAPGKATKAPASRSKAKRR
jgi:cyclophilin family peptidyl-prolyl cis-trans isomerase